MAKPVETSKSPIANRRDWIQAMFVLAVLGAAAIIVYDVSSKDSIDVNDAYRYGIIFGTTTLAMFVNLVSSSVTAVDPFTLVMVILLLVGVSLWVLSQALSISNDLRVNMMTFGSGLLGVFVGWISGKAQARLPNTGGS